MNLLLLRHLIFTVCILTATHFCFGQLNDPFFGDRVIGSADDILLVWNDNNEHTVRLQRYNFAGTNSCNAFTDTIQFLTEQSLIRPSLDQSTLDAFASDLDEDGYDEAVSLISETTDSTSLVVLVHHMESGTIQFDHEVVACRVAKSSLSEAVITPIELDGDLSKEILISVATKDGSIKVILLDGEQTTNLKVIGKSNVTSALRESYGVLYDVIAHDFDKNGKDEILMMGVREGYYEGKKKHSFFAEMYRPVLIEDDSIDFRLVSGFTDLLFKEDFNMPVVNLRLAAGDINGDHNDEFILAYQLRGDNSRSEYYIAPGYVSLDLRSLSIILSSSDLVYTESDNCCNAIGLTAGDVTLDGVDDILFAVFNDVLILQYQGDTAFALVKSISTGMGFDQNSVRRISISVDMDASVSQNKWRPEIAVLLTSESDENNQSTLQVFQPIECMDEFEIIQKASKTIITPGLSFNKRTSFAMVSGHFDDVGIFLGNPTVYYDRNIVQPLVVINAPPTHFDILDGQAYDISECYKGQGCDFKASYDEGTMEQEQITTSQTQDWGLDATIQKNFEVGGNKFDAYLTGRYGKTFSNVQSKSSSVTVGVNVNAMNDDMVFATISDYEIWEYPVHERDSFLGYMSVTVPLLTENRWFPSKSVSGNVFLPDHELGNILSYPEISEINNPDIVSEVIKGTTNSFTLGPKTEYEWRLEFSDFEENNVSEQTNVGIELGLAFQYGTEGDVEVSAEPAGVGVGVTTHYRATVGFGVTGKYAKTDFTSHTTSVKNELLLKVEMGDITGALTGYRISPFAFWSKSGTLVVDYAVEPELFSQGNYESWWQQKYGHKSDPALLLPWKYDPEKGYQIAHELQRTQTKDIVITPRNASAGDTVLLYTRIHNYSLLPTEDSVKIQWYMGDPDEGGELITGLEGETAKYTDGPMEARSSEWVHMLWVLPAYSGRIYAMLDGDHQVDEIHEDNNKGWINMGSGGLVSNIDFENEDSKTNFLGQNFPNPLTSITNIPFTIDEPGEVTIHVYDILGRLVSQVVDGYYPIGDHVVEFDGTKLENGMYEYRMEYMDQFATRKMIVMK